MNDEYTKRLVGMIERLEELLTEYKDAECRALKSEGEALKRIAELERQLRISKCCENENCDRKDCPMMAKP